MLLTPTPQSTCAQPSSYLRLRPETSYLDGFYAFAYWYYQHCLLFYRGCRYSPGRKTRRSVRSMHTKTVVCAYHAKNTKRARTALIRNDGGAAGLMRVQASSLWHLRGFDATAEAVKHGLLRQQYKPRKGCE